MPASSFQTILSDFAAPNCGLAPVIADHYKLRYIRTSHHGTLVLFISFLYSVGSLAFNSPRLLAPPSSGILPKA